MTSESVPIKTQAEKDSRSISDKNPNSNDYKTKTLRKRIKKEIKKLKKKILLKLAKKRNKLVKMIVLQSLRLQEQSKVEKRFDVGIENENNVDIVLKLLRGIIMINSIKMQAKHRSKIVNEMYELNAKLDKYGIEGASRESAAR
jgi:hypothetical protein